MIEIKNMTFAYEEKNIFENLNLDIKNGEKVALLGHNGAGKTTLVKLIAKLLKPQYTDKFNTYDSISVVFNSNQLYDDLTVLDNLKLFAHLYKKNVSDDFIQKYLIQVGIQKYIDATVGSLSTGYKQRVNIAKTLILDTDLVILDEPTSGFDPHSKTEIINVINSSYRDDKHTLILCSHDMDEVLEVASRIIFLKEGKIIFDKYIEEILVVLEKEFHLIKCNQEPNLKDEKAFVFYDGITYNVYYFGNIESLKLQGIVETVTRNFRLSDLYTILECEDNDFIVSQIFTKI